MDPKPGIYRHFKGNLYRVIGLAKHSETLEDLVVYSPLDTRNSDSVLWVRPKELFLEKVLVNGVYVPRFEYIE